jgi:Excalibur calcium-binding domain
MRFHFPLLALASLMLAACSSTVQVPAPATLAAGAAGHAFLGSLTGTTASGVGDLDCRDFASQADAQTYFDSKGGSRSNNVDALDWNHNGVPCEVNEDWDAHSPRWPVPTVTPTPVPTVTPAPSSGQCWVNGYYRKDGTYVHGYWRKC